MAFFIQDVQDADIILTVLQQLCKVAVGCHFDGGKAGADLDRDQIGFAELVQGKRVEILVLAKLKDVSKLVMPPPHLLVRDVQGDCHEGEVEFGSVECTQTLCRLKVPEDLLAQLFQFLLVSSMARKLVRFLGACVEVLGADDGDFTSVDC
tara:strand:- start:21784 stop:22236 length:453 start_codon:yes stop_codon:yes gene_type:complete